jgi:uncharacterized membrane protein YraQ (UPF0718 family)
MRQEPDSPQAPLPPDLDQMMADAQDTLQQGIQTLNEWGNQARQILKDRPGAVVASVAIAGFMTGALLRQKRLRTQASGKLTADPMVMFVAAAVAGFTMGPRILQEEQSAPPVRKPLP